jgi:hypothetical protein
MVGRRVARALYLRRPALAIAATRGHHQQSPPPRPGRRGARGARARARRRRAPMRAPAPAPRPSLARRRVRGQRAPTQKTRGPVSLSRAAALKACAGGASAADDGRGPTPAGPGPQQQW